MSRFLLIQFYPQKQAGGGCRRTIFTAIIFIVVAYSFGMAEK